MLHAADLANPYAGPRGPVRALDAVSFAVEPGEFVAVRGPSGCGKTTLLLVAGGLLRPDAGRVQIDARDPYALSPEARSRLRADAVGFVFQQFHLVPYLSVLDNVLAPSLASPAPDARDRARQLIERVGLAERADHVPAELSTGERQRVALARALLNRPKVLLADEPTGNLDADAARTVLEHLARFASAGGAVLLVTHDPAAADFAGRTIPMAAGRLLA
jgi:ABC-type lipoprotein export system ATPase subunit